MTNAMTDWVGESMQTGGIIFYQCISSTFEPVKWGVIVASLETYLRLLFAGGSEHLMEQCGKDSSPESSKDI